MFSIDEGVRPQDNTFDFKILTRQLELNAEVLMGRMTEHFTRLMQDRRKWISVEDRLPPNDCTVLIAIYDGRPKVEMFFIEMAGRMNQEWFYSSNGDIVTGKLRRVTHWMPLPDKPSKNDL